MSTALRRPLGVCMVTFAMPPEHSGAARQALTLAAHLAGSGVGVRFVTMRSTAAGADADCVAGFRVVRVVKRHTVEKAIAPLRVFLALFRERAQFDIVHVHGVGYLSSVAVLFGWCFGKATVIKMTMFTEDDALSVRSRRFGAITYAFFSRASRIVAITDSFYRSCVAAGIPEARVARIPNGVDTQLFMPVGPDRKRELRRAMSLPEQATLLVYAGIIREEKGIDVLLDVVGQLAAWRRDVALVLLGPVESWLPAIEQRYAAAQLARIAEGDVKGLVYYRGDVSNVSEYFQASDIFVSASRREGFPNVVLEAMASGLPPVVLEVSDVHANVLENGRDSVVVSPPDRRDLAGRVKELIDDPELRQRLAEAAVAKARAGFSARKVADDYLALYRSLVG